jgi:hypothetical protein
LKTKRLMATVARMRSACSSLLTDPTIPLANYEIW